jgi:branched-chain amino acid transport system substrate-binding protein
VEEVTRLAQEHLEIDWFRRLGRRQFLGGAAGGILGVTGLSLVACGSSSSSTSAVSGVSGGRRTLPNTQAAHVAQQIGYDWSDVDLSGIQVTIGQILALTGGASFFGTVEAAGSKLAAQHIKDAGGPSLDFSAEDNQSGLPNAAVAAARKLTAQKNVPLIQTSFPAATLAIIPVIEDAQTLTFQIAGGTLSQLNAGKYLWMGGPLGTEPFPALSDYIKSTLPAAKTGAIMVWDEKDSLAAAADSVKKPWESDSQHSIIAQETVEIGTQDMSAAIARIKSKNPDALFLVLFGADWATAIKQARNAGLNVPIVGSQWNSQGHTVTGSSDENYVWVGYAFDATLNKPFMRLFADDYKKANNADPEIYAGFAYENTWLIADLIARVVRDKGDPTSKTDLYNAFIKSPKAPASLLGPGYSWDSSTHEYSQPQAISQVKGGNSGLIGLVIDGKLNLGKTLADL